MTEPVSDSPNPYSAPLHDTEYQGLPPGVAFLLTDEGVLCGEVLVLPEICIETGEVDQLAECHKTIKCSSDRLRKVGYVILFALIPATIHSCSQLRSGNRVTSLRDHPDLMVSLVLMVTLIPVAIFVWGQFLRRQRNVRVTWYVTTELYESSSRVRLRNRVVSGVGMLCFLTGLYANLSVSWILLIGSVFVLLSMRKTPRQLPAPRAAGFEQGLVVMSGFSREFLDRVYLLAEGRHVAEKSQ